MNSYNPTYENKFQALATPRNLKNCQIPQKFTIRWTDSVPRTLTYLWSKIPMCFVLQATERQILSGKSYLTPSFVVAPPISFSSTDLGSFLPPTSNTNQTLKFVYFSQECINFPNFAPKVKVPFGLKGRDRGRLKEKWVGGGGGLSCIHN